MQLYVWFWPAMDSPVKYEKEVPMYGFETLKTKKDIIVSMQEQSKRMVRL